MSKPLENYIIRIKSSIDQFDNEGVIREEDRDHIELLTRGSFTKKNGSYYISYKAVSYTHLSVFSRSGAAHIPRLTHPFSFHSLL